MPCDSSIAISVEARVSNASSSSNDPGTKRMLSDSRCHTSSRNPVRAPCSAADLASAAKSPSPQSRRAKPTIANPGGSRPRLARS